MTALSQLDHWRRNGAITAAQHDAIAALVRRERFSVFVELNALLYLGVTLIAAGIAWTISVHAARLGDVAILVSLTTMFAGTLYYCVSRSPPYSHHRVEPPGLAFDYVLYLGCLVFAADLGYVQSQFHPFQLDWDHTLLLASAVFFALAYRFDNRLVLSLALASLGAWCGVRVSQLGLRFGASLRGYALVYGSLVAGAGTGFYRAGIKTHFLDTYLHVAANVILIALLTGVGGPGGFALLYLLALVALAAVALVQGLRSRRFAFVVYGVIYGYAGISTQLLKGGMSPTAALAYFVVSGTIVVAALVALARRFGREE